MKKLLLSLVKNIVRQFKNFWYSFEGILFCIKYERSLRIHLIVTTYAFYFARFYNFSKIEYLIIFIVCALEMSAELLNTAIECVVDKVSPERHVLAKAAKDAASGAVGVFSLLEIVTAVILYFDKAAAKKIAEYFSSPFPLICLIISFIAAVFFIFVGAKRSAISNAKYLEKLKEDNERMEKFLKKHNDFLRFFYDD